VGSGSAASRLGMNKVQTKKAWERAGLPTPAYRLLRRGQAVAEVAAPCVVKAVASGSSIDVHICQTPDQAARAISEVCGKHGEALVEQYIAGPELTVGLLEEQPLAPIRIISQRPFFDYQAKYEAVETEHRFDTGLPPEVVSHCRQLAKQANEVVGARDLARVDIMVDGQNHPYLLEINTMPGFTPRSLLPEAAQHAGIEFDALVERLVRRAAARPIAPT
jgi:D-alanine-D-alanine ligase